MDQSMGAQAMHRFTYRGRIGEIYKIWFINFLLQLITLGIYRFWGKTRLRRYFWSCVSFDGQPFEYTGTGGELFRGFLIVFVLAAVPLLTLNYLPIYNPLAGAISAIILVPFLIVLGYAAIFSAFRYRLSRTNWSGIHGGLQGSMWRYGVLASLVSILQLLTLGLLGPWVAIFNARYITNRASFGNISARLSEDTRQHFKLYLLCMLLSWACLAVGFGVLYARIGGSVGWAELNVRIQAQDIDAIMTLITAVVGFYLYVVLVLVSIFTFFRAVQIREIVNHIQWGALQVHLKLRYRDYMKIFFFPSLLIAVTAGLAEPLVRHWRCRFIANHLFLEGPLDLMQVKQSALEKPKRGEGLLEALDVPIDL